jgi:DHA1 family tetracycline resistance protein-like MFS transporter
MGATVGFGFLVGPTIGGLLAPYGLSVPLYAAAALMIVNMIFGFFVLPESLDKKHRMADFSLHHLNPFAQLTSVLKNMHIRLLITVGVYYFLPFAIMQGISSVYYKEVIHWNPTQIGFLFLILGVGDMFTQGYLSGKLLPKLGEVRLALMGFGLTGLAYGMLAFLPIFPHDSIVYIYIAIYALGSGLFEPSFSALISRSAAPSEQGRVQGASQSMGSITRVIGPILAAWSYVYLQSAPYIIAAILSALGAFYLLKNKKIINRGIAANSTSS